MFRGEEVLAAVLENEDTKNHAKVTDRRELGKMFDGFSLIKKRPCECAHGQTAELRTAESIIQVSLCGHCFDILDEGSVEHYRMPKAFFEEFERRLPSE